MTLHILRAPTGPTRPLVQLRVYVEVFDALERTENGRQEQLCDPLVPENTLLVLVGASLSSWPSRATDANSGEEASHDRSRPDACRRSSPTGSIANETPARTPLPPTAMPSACFCASPRRERESGPPRWTSLTSTPDWSAVSSTISRGTDNSVAHPQRPPRRDPLLFPVRLLRHPEHAEAIQQVLAIPRKKTERRPDPFSPAPRWTHSPPRPTSPPGVGVATTYSRRGTADRASSLGTHRAAQSGRRARHGSAPQVPRQGPQAPRHPARQTDGRASARRLRERRGEPDDALFPSRRGGKLSPDAVQRLVTKHVTTARTTCPTWPNKQISTHNLRHSCAMDLLRNGLDVAVLAMWLGHEKLESVNAYIHADPTLKERALDRLTPLNPAAKPGRYRPTDELLAFLEGL